jgi:hypothetical protein
MVLSKVYPLLALLVFQGCMANIGTGEQNNHVPEEVKEQSSAAGASKPSTSSSSVYEGPYDGPSRPPKDCKSDNKRAVTKTPKPTSCREAGKTPGQSSCCNGEYCAGTCMKKGDREECTCGWTKGGCIWPEFCVLNMCQGEPQWK